MQCNGARLCQQGFNSCSLLDILHRFLETIVQLVKIHRSPSHTHTSPRLHACMNLRKSLSTCQMIVLVHDIANIWCILLQSGYIVTFYLNSSVVIYIIFLLSFYEKGYEAIGERVDRVDRGRKWRFHSNSLGYYW